MQIIEAYNASATKQMLYRIMREYCVEGTERKVSWGNIYDILGRETAVFTPYHTGDERFLTELYTFPVLCPKDVEGFMEADDLLRFCGKKYKTGSYFHFYSEKEGVDERMVINVTDQYHAAVLVRYLLFTAEREVRHIKFYAVEQAAQGKVLKFDKVVIYYYRMDRDVIYNRILEGAREYACTFRGEVNGFLHVAGDEQGHYPVGVGMELPDGDSFTERIAKKVFKELTGLDAEGKEKREAYGVLNVNYTNEYMDGIFERVVLPMPSF